MDWAVLFLFYLPLLLGQFLPVIAAAGVTGLLLRRKFGWLRPFAVTAVLLILLLIVNLFHPMLFCPAEFRPYLTDGMKSAIREFFTGTNDFPVFPLYLIVEDAREGYAEVRKVYITGWAEEFTISTDADGNFVPEKVGPTGGI